MYTNVTGIHNIEFPQLAESDHSLLDLAVMLLLEPSRERSKPYYRSFRNLSYSIEIAHIDEAIKRKGLDPEYVKPSPLGKAIAKTGIGFVQPAWKSADTSRREYRALLRWVLKTPGMLELLLKFDTLLREAGIDCSGISDIAGDTSSFNAGIYGFPGLDYRTNKTLQELTFKGYFDLCPQNPEDLNTICKLRTSGYLLSFSICYGDDIEDEYGQVIQYGDRLIRVHLDRQMGYREAPLTSSNDNMKGND